MCRVCSILISGLLTAFWIPTLWGQTPATPTPAAGKTPTAVKTPAAGKTPSAVKAPAAAQNETKAEPALPPAMAKFKKAYSAYVKAGVKARDLQRQYVALSTTEEQKEEIGAQLEKLSEYLTKLYPILMDLAEKAWTEAPSADPEILRFIVEVLDVKLVTEDYEGAQQILAGLIKERIPQLYLADLYDVAGETCFMLNDFEKAGQFYEQATKAEVLSERGALLQKDISYQRVGWAKEKILRDREAKADDLPRVVFKTTQGDITFELFENEAPNTVANFIYLAKKGFYDGMYFDPVIPGLFAESGRSMESEDGGPGYTIRDEFDEKNARRHYRGTLSMTRTAENSAGSRFYISFAPQKELDGKAVVFGRVIKGMDVLSKITRMDPQNPDPMAEPDMIESVEVLRTRDHKYVPKIIKPQVKAALKVDTDSEGGEKTKVKKEKKTGAY